MIKDTKDFAILGLCLVALVLAAGVSMNIFTPQQDKVVMRGLVSNGSGTPMMNAARLDSSAAWPGFGLDKRLISSSGSVTKTYAPDEALLSFSVETLDKSASVSQAKNAEIATKVREALKAMGLADNAVKTTSYNLNEEFQWNDTTKKSESTGFRTSNTIQVKVSDLSMTGKVIDAAVKAGVNRVDSVMFSLSKDREAQVRSDLLLEAAADAKSKADKIAGGFGVKVARLYTASEGYSYVPVYNALNYAKSAGPAPEAAYDTPITAGDVKVTVNVDAQFEIE